jgi:diguanylate cyclase (GGDEF)-like protein
LIAVALLSIGALDYATASAPVQHLYYLPIMWAGIRFGRRGGLTTALVAVAFYHLANPHLLMLQIVLFVTVGLVTTTLAEDAERMRLLAHTDDLTGLHNLRSFEARLAQLVDGARPRRSVVSLFVLDVDRLKAINDAYGHLAGAEGVRTVGEIIADQIPPSAVACRYGGDEFVIALPDGCEGAVQLAESLRASVYRQEPILAGYRLPAGALSISIGVASRTMTSDGETATLGEELFQDADRALYAAKAEGRNRVCVTAEPAVAALQGEVRLPQPANYRGPR